MTQIEKSAISWKCSGEKVFLDFPYLQIVERLCLPEKAAADAEAHRFYVLKSRDWCNIIPVTEEGNVVLVRQFRAGTLSTSLEFPGGVVESNDADVQATAIREMVEETGYEPLPNARCTLLGASHPNPALQDNRMHSLIVGPVKKTRGQKLDPAEDIEVLEVPVAEFPRLIAEGQFGHALMLTSLLHLMMKNTGAETRMVDGMRRYAAST